MRAITKKDIALNNNRALVFLDDKQQKVAQYIAFDLDPSTREKLVLQLMTAFNICNTFDQIDKHLKINGLDAYLEDIYDLY